MQGCGVVFALPISASFARIVFSLFFFFSSSFDRRLGLLRFCDKRKGAGPVCGRWGSYFFGLHLINLVSTDGLRLVWNSVCHCA